MALVDTSSEGCFTTAVQKTLPIGFIVRVMWHFKERLDMAKNKKDEQVERRCYYEHIDEEEQIDCRSEHMTYNRNDDLGYFR
jgi:hypothetical protein